MQRIFFTALNLLAGALNTRGRREDGQTMAEYAMLLAVIALVVVAVAVLLGSSISAIFRSASSRA